MLGWFIMVLEPELVAVFILGYKTVLLEIADSDQNLPVLNQFALARDRLRCDSRLFDIALKLLETKYVAVDARVITVVRSLKVKCWIYLRDSRSYSVFLDDKAEESYAVCVILPFVSKEFDSTLPKNLKRNHQQKPTRTPSSQPRETPRILNQTGSC